MTPRVSLVGAGPGDPELLTIAALRRLKRADLVLYDALVSQEILSLAPNAQRFCVGKRSGRVSFAQETIHRLMIRGARRGKKVVRLKGGDPFVLGRGGEEALALAEAGVPFEVIPGVSSAVAAPALSGIPVTHRGLAAGFVVLSGHSEAAWSSAVSSLHPGSLTLVVLMGVASRGAIASRLMERGWPQATPAAMVLGASTPEACSWRGTLQGLGAALIPDQAKGLPGTVVIGEVVSLAGHLAGRTAHEAWRGSEVVRSSGKR